uniref:PDZ domain-containing protein n=1 Tax=Coccolithus braarudii TaxID=221442 RepID=A0A7S0LAG5_9EUKA
MSSLRATLLLLAASCGQSFLVGSLPGISRTERTCRTASSSNIQMINLFGNTDDSKKQRNSLSLRSAQAGDRKVTFRKPPTATQGITLGLKFRESFGKAVYIDQIVPGTEAARLEKEGKVKKGDEVVMVSATFGDEMWSARNVGKYRLEKSIAVRQGMTISFVLENSDDNSKKARQAAAERAKKENEKMSRLQSQLTKEVEDEKKKGSFFGGFF